MTSRGWDVLRWAHRYLPSPADPRQPLVLTDEQARFVVAWYEIDGRGLLRLQSRRDRVPEGLGQERRWARYSLWPSSQARSQRRRRGCMAACSEDQAVSNTYSLLWAMLSENDGRAARELGIDLGRGRKK